MLPAVKITAFIGVMGSGKDYRANQLVKENFVRVDFKDALIEMAEDLLGYSFSKTEADYERFKVCIPGCPATPHELQDIASCINGENDFKKVWTGRTLLQRLGTDVMRRRDRDYWVKEWRKRVGEHLWEQEPKNIVCADCRFQNEVEMIQCMTSHYPVLREFIFCDYKSERYNATSGHVSERLAQRLKLMGKKDGEHISATDFLLCWGHD